MTLDLTKQDLVNLVAGTSPFYDVWKFIPDNLYSYTGGFSDRFQWNKLGLEKLSENELYSLYRKIFPNI